MNLKDYKTIALKDFQNDNIIYSIILLNKKHTTKEFQDEIDKIVEEKYEEINLYGDDWQIVKKYINKKFDWIELNYNNEFLQI